MKNTKFILALMIATMIIFQLEAATIASGSDCGDDCSWKLDDKGVLTITGNGDVKNSYTGWRSVYSDIKEVVVEKGITRVGQFAFQNAPNLKKVTLPETLTSLGGDVFNGASNLAIINFPSKLNGAAGWGFCGTNIKEVILPPAAKVIGSGAFDSSSLQKIVLNDGLEEIQYRAFRLTDIEEITIPSTVTKIDSEAFSNCNLKKLVLNPNDNLVINSNAFWEIEGNFTVYCMVDTKICDAKLQSIGLTSLPYPKEPQIERRIYTIEEANQVAGKTNSFKIRYR